MPDPDLEIRGGGETRSSRPLDKGGARSPKKVFRPFGPQFGLEIRVGGPPLDPPLAQSEGVLPRRSQDVVRCRALFHYFAIIVFYNHLLRNAFRGMW